MSWKLAGPCSAPGCPERAIKRGLCREHLRQRQQRYDDQRGTEAERGYGARWQRLRRMLLAEQPLCADPFGQHGGYPARATDVDHILPRRAGGDDSADNLQALCHECHSRKTASETSPGWVGGSNL